MTILGKSKNSGALFSNLPLKFRPVAQAFLDKWRTKFIDQHGHPPSQPQWAMMIGRAVAVTRNHRMKTTKWKAGQNRAFARKRMARKALGARLAATSPTPPERHPEPRTFWSPLLIS